MKSKADHIEDAIQRVYRRIERIDELLDLKEYGVETAEAAAREAFDDLSELQLELDEELRREDIARNRSTPQEDSYFDRWDT